MKTIPIIVGFVLVLPFVIALPAIKWEGKMQIPGYILTIDLPDTPIWETPPKPKFSDFPAEYIKIREDEKIHTITVHRRLGETIFTAATYLWPITGFFSVLHFLIRRKVRSRALLLCVDIFTGISISLLICFILYALIGGWGPPFPAFFLTFGIALGFSVFLLFHANTKNQISLTSRWS